MSKNGFMEFLESEAKKKPLKVEGRVNKKEVLKEAKLLANRITEEDVELIRNLWEDRDYDVIAIVLRKYGLEFKGIVYTEKLIKEFLRIVKKPEDS
ncbi:TPA: hypothetical protein EYP75_03740 [Candidatus Bathyarchaeota archaeon]|nr:hypothetical protein [Candidatus Bathyarchaeota archaeon]